MYTQAREMEMGKWEEGERVHVKDGSQCLPSYLIGLHPENEFYIHLLLIEITWASHLTLHGTRDSLEPEPL